MNVALSFIMASAKQTYIKHLKHYAISYLTETQMHVFVFMVLEYMRYTNSIVYYPEK
jgi:hypothetical protein